MNYDTLPYPLFKITKAEADLLVGASESYKVNLDTAFLCSQLKFAADNFGYSLIVLSNLKSKINSKLFPFSTLESFVRSRTTTEFMHPTQCHMQLMRKIWINKLLEFNGYEQVEQ